jgi:hypothetical protein
MAQEIRTSVGQHKLPEFRLESNQTRLLIDFMKSKNVPIQKWEEIVAPHAHHYFPVSGYVGVQYPPGTGLILAAFPEGTAVYRLNQFTVVILVVVGIAAIAVAAWKKAWISAGLVALAIHLSFSILSRIGALSFSINAVLAPLLLTCVLVVVSASLRFTHYRLAYSLALAAGVLLGLCTMVRLPSVLFAPAFLIVLWPGSWRIRLNSLPVVFMLATVMIGILPVLVNQQHVAGAWYLATYASVDAALPTLARVRENFSYFFGFDGPAADDNWALVVAVIGFAAFLAWRAGSNRKSETGLTWKRLALAAAAAWLLPIGFFLSHAVTGAHYMIPSIVATVSLLGFGALALEVTNPVTSIPFKSGPIASALALACLLFVGIVLVRSTLITRSDTAAPAGPLAHQRIVLPSELTDEKAWVWADLLTGSLWYYTRKPAFKIEFTDPQTRELLYKFVFDRGEQQYVIQDSERMRTYMDEIVKLGGTLEERGQVDGQLYFLVHWPKDGPALTNQPNRMAMN